MFPIGSIIAAKNLNSNSTAYNFDLLDDNINRTSYDYVTGKSNFTEHTKPLSEGVSMALVGQAVNNEIKRQQRGNAFYQEFLRLQKQQL